MNGCVINYAAIILRYQNPVSSHEVCQRRLLRIFELKFTNLSTFTGSLLWYVYHLHPHEEQDPETFPSVELIPQRSINQTPGYMYIAGKYLQLGITPSWPSVINQAWLSASELHKFSRQREEERNTYDSVHALRALSKRDVNIFLGDSKNVFNRARKCII